MEFWFLATVALAFGLLSWGYFALAFGLLSWGHLIFNNIIDLCCIIFMISL